MIAAEEAYGESIQSFDSAIRVHSKLFSSTAYVFTSDRMQIVAHRGSADAHDWFINAQAMPWRYDGRWCHAGFAMAHSAIWKDIVPLLSPNLPVLVTGHSLGGAMAELSACRLSDHGAEVNMITFGKPNVFFRPKKSQLEFLKTQLSVVSGSDLVTRIPRFMYGPDAGQSKLYLANDGNDYYNPDQAFVTSDWSYKDMGSDHFTALYKERVSRLLGRLSGEEMS